MIQSMTGFGKAQIKDEKHNIQIEIRSLNNRYAEVRIFGVKDNLDLENEMIVKTKKKFHRGKIDVNVRTTLLGTSRKLDEKTILQHYKNLQKLAQKMNLSDTIDLSTVLNSLPYQPKPLGGKKLSRDIIKTLDQALEQLEKARFVEGGKLLTDITKRLRWIEKEIKSLEKRTRTVVKRKSKELKKKIFTMIDDKKIDPSRLEMEVAILVEKSDITEELVRLTSHLETFSTMTQHPSEQKGVGRKMDFLLQEMNREVNTIGAKVSDAHSAQSVVQIKSELEKIREQVQNIE